MTPIHPNGRLTGRLGRGQALQQADPLRVRPRLGRLGPRLVGLRRAVQPPPTITSSSMVAPFGVGIGSRRPG